MKLLPSTVGTDDGMDTPALNAIAEAIANSTETTIISAFYDEEFLLELMGNVPTSMRADYRITMVFNGAYGRRLSAQVADLKSLRSRLRKSRFGSVDIRLIRIPGGLFHTKLYLVQNRTQPQWFVGSANATNNGFRVNDEILLKLIGRHDELRSYTRDTIKKSYALDAEEFDAGPEDLTTFLRDGSLYFKSSAQVSFSYPTKLPDTVVDKIAELNIRPRYTDPALPFSAFNIRRAISEDINIDIRPERRVVRIRSYSVETCLGYWVPTALTEVVDARIEEKSGHQLQQLERLAEEMAQPERRSRTLVQFGDFLSDIEQATGERLQRGTMADSFAKYYDRLASRLSKPAMRERYARPLTDTSVPEIWDDPVASADFKETFLLDVCSRIATGPRGIVKTILNTIGLPADQLIDHEDLENHLSRVIKVRGIRAFRWANNEEDEDDEE